MSELFIDDKTRSKIATRWVVVSLWALHAWASLLVLAVLIKKEPSNILGDMFATVTFGIGATLLVLLLDRAGPAILARFSTAPLGSGTKVEETVTRTVTPVAPAEAPPTVEGGQP